MKIAYYIHYTAIKSGGIFTYSLGVLNLLINTPEVKELILVYSGEQKEYLGKYFDNPKVKPLLVDRGSKLTNLKLMLSYFLYDTYFIYKEYVKNPAKLGFLKKLSNFFNPYKKVKSAGADVFHVPMQFSPAYNIGIPVAITMHDVQELHFPENFDSSERMHRAINAKKAIEEAQHTFVSFSHVKRDVQKFFAAKDDDVSVCLPPIAEDWFEVKQVTPLNELKKSYNIPDKFILLPAATWTHKNHISLLKALKILKEGGKPVFLVSTGNKTDYYSVLEEYINENGLNDLLNFTGIIPEEDLLGLFESTASVVIPTLYEAGSGPMFEAMKYGAPVIASNVTSLPDSMDNDEFIFDPYNPEEIADKITLILEDEEYLKRNKANSERRIKDFKEIDYAGNFVKVYKRLLI